MSSDKSVMLYLGHTQTHSVILTSLKHGTLGILAAQTLSLKTRLSLVKKKKMQESRRTHATFPYVMPDTFL